jgi:hydrogenase expression/formation protein HypD
MRETLQTLRDPVAVHHWIDRIKAKVAELDRPLRIMEVCGTHTVAISRSGIRSLLTGYVDMVSGPGCPVCVTADQEVDRLMAYCDLPGAIIATYGDLLRVPGTGGSLADRRASGADVRVVYSPLDAVAMAEANPDRPVILLGIGFETTAPASALALQTAAERGIFNFFLHSAHKLTPPAMRALLDSGEVRLDGFLCPGHVSTVLGEAGFAFLAAEYGLPAAIAGFEPMDILLAVDYIADAALGREPVALRNTYGRWVPPGGNEKARRLMEQTFMPADADWRGLGRIPASGLALRPAFELWSAEAAFPAAVPPAEPKRGCRCGDVLRGQIQPPECPHFGRACRPESPFGPCMVSGEGACAAYYRYGEGAEPAPVVRRLEATP